MGLSEETLGEHIWNLGNMLATSRECHGNTLGKTKIQQPHPPPNEGKKTPKVFSLVA